MKVRDASGSRTVAAIRMRDAANVLRVVSGIKARDAANALKIGYSSAALVTITPAVYNTVSDTSTSNTSDFTVSSSIGVPSAYVWSADSAFLVSGQGTPTARFTVYDPGTAGVTATLFCDVTIGGTVYRATASKRHRFRNFEGGGTL